MRRIINFGELDSTSIYARQHLEELNDFDIVSAEKQTLGHGQFQRGWYSTDTNGGNVYISIVLKPLNLEHLNELTRFVAFVCAQTLEEYGLKPGFKFPNDILIDGRKIAGFLAESEFFGQVFKGVVLGCGINLNLTDYDVKKIQFSHDSSYKGATSVFLETGKRVDKPKFLKKFLDNFEKQYNDFLINGIKEKILC